jgi:chemotaxis-related protein WspB
MLVVMCRVADQRFAFDARLVDEVLPLVRADPLSDGPAWRSGLIACRGESIPLVDLTRLVVGRPAAARLNSRILLVRSTIEGAPGRVGVLAEGVTAVEIPPLASPSAASESLDRLGPVLRDGSGIFRLLDLDRLLRDHSHGGAANGGAAP